jgi:hypothetical protein
MVEPDEIKRAYHSVRAKRLARHLRPLLEEPSRRTDDVGV